MLNTDINNVNMKHYMHKTFNEEPLEIIFMHFYTLKDLKIKNNENNYSLNLERCLLVIVINNKISNLRIIFQHAD